MLDIPKKNVRNIVLSFVCMVLVGCASGQKYTVDGDLINDKISATVDVTFKEIAIVIGGIKGEGVLHYQGEPHRFTMKGVDYGSISKVTMDTTGNVYHMDRLEEFEGLYLQAKAGVTIGESGKSGMFLVNRRGVTIHLSSQQEKGFDVSLGRGGIKIKFEKL